MTDLTIRMGKLPNIEANFEEVKAELAEILKSYDYPITDVPTAKADRAKLNRISRAIDERRKAVKAEYLEPYNEFEKRIKELNGMILIASSKIDYQIKLIEDEEKEAKRTELEKYFNEHNDILTLDFEDIFDERWLNKTYNINSAKIDIEDAIEEEREAAKTKVIKFKAILNKKQAEALTKFLKDNEISYEVI